MSVKKYFYAVKHIVPYEMEDDLEQLARRGYLLKNVGQTGLLYFDFREVNPAKYRYVVDYTKLPKAMYMEALIEKGWEYLGMTGDCYIWRMKYEEDVVPEKFSDKECLKKQCTKLGIIFVVLAVLCMAAAGGTLWGISYEHKMGIPIHTVPYAIEAILQLPFIVLFFRLASKLFNAVQFYDY